MNKDMKESIEIQCGPTKEWFLKFYTELRAHASYNQMNSKRKIMKDQRVAIHELKAL